MNELTQWILLALTFLGGWHFGRTTQDLPADPGIQAAQPGHLQGTSACAPTHDTHARLAVSRF